MNTDKHGPAGPATGGAAPTAADDLPWPPWLENLSDEERITAIVRAVAVCAAGHTGPHDDGSAAQHCTVVMAEHFLAKLLTGVSLGEQPHDPAHCDRDGQPHLGPCADPGGGVTRWTVTRVGLIEALRSVTGRLWTAKSDANAVGISRPDGAELADAILAQLGSGSESSTGEMAGAASLVSLAAALERRADRIGDHGLTRDGSIRARVLREAAGMARRRAQGGQESAYAPGPVSLDPPGVSAGGTEALTAAQDDDSDLTEDGWPL